MAMYKTFCKQAKTLWWNHGSRRASNTALCSSAETHGVLQWYTVLREAAGQDQGGWQAVEATYDAFCKLAYASARQLQSNMSSSRSAFAERLLSCSGTRCCGRLLARIRAEGRPWRRCTTPSASKMCVCLVAGQGSVLSGPAETMSLLNKR